MCSWRPTNKRERCTAISIIRDPADPLAQQPAVGWAVDQLRSALQSKDARAGSFDASAGNRADQVIVVAAAHSDRARPIMARAGVSVPAVPEALGLVPDGTDGLLATGSDSRGLIYALLELADRMEHADDPVQALRLDAPVVEQPANAVRSVARFFASEINDKPWLHDGGLLAPVPVDGGCAALQPGQSHGRAGL